MDRFAGTPACAALSLVERVRRVLSPPRPHTPRRMLFIKLIEMGSTVLAGPAFEEAARRVGRENLFILVFRPNRAILDMLPYFLPENIISIDDSSFPAFVTGLLAALRRIRREAIDTAIDLEGLTRSSAIITYLTGATCRVGYHNFTSEGPYRGRLFTHELTYNFQHHVSRMFRALVLASATDPSEQPLLKAGMDDVRYEAHRFSCTPAEQKEVLDILSRQCGNEPPPVRVLLNANCSDLLPLRRWPTAHFVELGRRLLATRPDIGIILTGAPDEREGAAQIAAAIGAPPRVISLAGHTTLRQLLILYGLSHCLVSNDSGPCHFAAMTPIHTIALFGPETPLLYGPLGTRATCLSAGLACSPCVNILNHRFSPCRNNRCMQAIPVSRVLDETIRVLPAPPENTASPV